MSNPFKQRLLAGQRLVGMWLSMADPYLAEASSTTGFDWLLVDGEHAPNDLRSTLGALQAIAPSRCAAVVRPVQGDPQLIKQLLDIGAQNLLVPMVDTAQQAQQLVQATRYPPAGIRGMGSGAARASCWGLRTDYLEVADDEACLLVQAESVTALRNLQAICEVPGVDGVFIGPSDLAASMGHRGRPKEPQVQAAIESAIATVLRAGKPCGTLTTDVQLARRYLELGCTFVAVGVDIQLFTAAARQLSASFGAGPPRAAQDM